MCLVEGQTIAMHSCAHAIYVACFMLHILNAMHIVCCYMLHILDVHVVCNTCMADVLQATHVIYCV